MTVMNSLRGIDAIKQAFQERKANGGGVFIPYVVAGDPDSQTSFEIASALCEAGTDILELGMPFSDPMADGPVNQRAAYRALEGGMDFPGLLSIVKKLRSKGHSTPIICMTYVNPLMRRGFEQIAADSAAAGLDGFIVVDAPPEESAELGCALAAHNLAMVCLIAPTSTDERIGLISDAATGFLYYVSCTGVTGARDNLADDLEQNLGRIKARTDLPVVVGFGIKAPEQATQVVQHADGAVVGSALVDIVDKAEPAQKAKIAADFVRPIIDAVHKGL